MDCFNASMLQGSVNHAPVSYTHLIDRRIAVGTVVIFAGNQYPEKEDDGKKDWKYRTYDKDTL